MADEDPVYANLRAAGVEVPQADAQGNVINYRKPVAPIGAIPDRASQIQALLPSLPGLSQGPDGIVVAPRESGDIADRWLGSHPTYGPAYNEHKNALNEANQYLTAAQHMSSLKHEIASKLDSADFLREISAVDHTSPDYEKNLSGLLAKYPLAAGTGVTEAVNIRNAGRKNYLDSQKLAAGEDKDFEKRVQDAAAKGFINPDDLFTWDGQDATRPPVYNADGSLNHHQVDIAIARGAAQQAEEANQKDITKQLTADEAEKLKAATSLIHTYKSPPPVADPGYKDYHAAIATVVRNLRGVKGAPTTTAPTTEPAPIAAPVLRTAKDYTSF